jgi:polysaccharide pyruvyl transferase WcaK-like protein
MDAAPDPLLQAYVSSPDPSLDEALPRHVDRREMTFISRFLPAQIAECDVAMACEGSMFKSNFSDAISLVMLGALALAIAEGKLAVGYGAEAGDLTPPMEAFARPDVPASALVALLQQSSVLISSPFHAIVCAMPAGVPVIGVSYDERIENLRCLPN